MGYYTTAEIVKIVNKLIDRCGTRDPYKVAKELGINVIYRNFDKQRGAYKVILKNRFVFLKNGMHPVVEQIVLWHEIGHDVLHRQEAVAVGGFKEFNIFDMRENRMEYEANIFASQASLPDDTILEYIKNGYDIILDVTLLDPAMEHILQEMLTAANYNQIILMIAISPTVTEKFLSGRAWRHTKETEAEFIRATKKSIVYYAENHSDTHIILWSVYDKPPIFDGKIKDCLDIFEDYSNRTELPKKDDDERREAKINYLKSL